MSDNEVYRIENRKDRVRLVTRDWTATLIKRRSTHLDERQQYYAKTRVYGAVDTFASSELKAYDSAVSADPRANHHTLRRAATSAARTGLLAALDTLASEDIFNVNFHDLVTGEIHPSEDTFKVKFSSKAGCSCGCSPGFIVDGDVLRVHGAHVDVWFSTRYEDSLTRVEREELKRARRDGMEVTRKDLAQAVFYGLTELDAIKQELGV